MHSGLRCCPHEDLLPQEDPAIPALPGHRPWHLAHGLSPSHAPPALPCLPAGTPWAVRPLPLHSLTALSPMTFSFPLFQQTDAIATREMECSMQTLCGHNLLFFCSVAYVLPLPLLCNCVHVTLSPSPPKFIPSLIQPVSIVRSVPPTFLNEGHLLAKPQHWRYPTVCLFGA